jgi:hypothetical protein
VFEGAFLGGELRYLADYEDGFEHRLGQAVYLGPTGYWEFSENAYVKATVSFQVAGHSRTAAAQNLDLDNFERIQSRVEVGVQF